MEFLSTLSLRRATLVRLLRTYWYSISIHALLAESDKCSLGNPRKKPYFYPRSPCGERLSCAWSASKLGDFYPRSPCGERLSTMIITICIALFLSTLSLRRATFVMLSALAPEEFLSTLSLRRATRADSLPNAPPHISIHALLAESDRKYHRVDRVRACISIHALLAESDPG